MGDNSTSTTLILSFIPPGNCNLAGMLARILLYRNKFNSIQFICKGYLGIFGSGMTPFLGLFTASLYPTFFHVTWLQPKITTVFLTSGSVSFAPGTQGPMLARSFYSEVVALSGCKPLLHGTSLATSPHGQH